MRKLMQWTGRVPGEVWRWGMEAARHAQKITLFLGFEECVILVSLSLVWYGGEMAWPPGWSYIAAGAMLYAVEAVALLASAITSARRPD